jgi:hypothetical protein
MRLALDLACWCALDHPCHAAELLDMADRIGVQRKWIQKAGSKYEHFDIALSKRALAVKHGAVEVSRMDLGRLIRDGKVGVQEVVR